MIDRLDSMISGETVTALPMNGQNEKDLVLWAYLKLAVQAIELTAINDRVAIVRQYFFTASAVKTPPQGAIVRNIFRNSLRIAAILIVFLGAAAIYKYNAVSSALLYEQNYTSYTLGTVRGNTDKNVLEEAYKNKDWQTVLALFSQDSEKTAKSYFLAGMAEMELRHFPEAMNLFESVLSDDGKTHGSYFKDEAEYYLAMSCLMNEQPDKGVAMLKKIRKSKDHLYYPLANRISGVDLSIMDIKGKK
jgi:tetratricopeptide (TPR) repeat protein